MPDDKKTLYGVDWDTVDVSGPYQPETNLYGVNWDEVVQDSRPNINNEIGIGQQIGGEVTKGLFDTVKSMIGGMVYEIADEVSTDPASWLTLSSRMAMKPFTETAKLIGTFFPSTELNEKIGYLEEEYKSLGGLLSSEEKLKREKEIRDEIKREIFQASEDASAWLDELIPTDEQAGFWAADLPRGFGSMTGFMLAALASRGKGLSPGLVSAFMGAQSEGFSMMEEAYKITNDIDLAEDVGRIGKVIGTSEGLPIANMFKKFEALTDPAKASVFKDILKKYLGKVAGRRTGEVVIGSVVQGMEEAIQEMGQSFAENLTAQQMYDFERSLTEGMDTGGAVGFITGTVMAALGFGGTLLKHRMTPQELETAKKVYEDMKDKFEAKYDEDSKLNKITTSLGAVYNMGKEGAITFEGISPEDDARGRGNVQAHFGQILKASVDALDNNPDANIVDAAFQMGQNIMKTYLDGANTNQEGKEYFSHAIDEEMISSLTAEQLSETSDEMYFKAVAKGMEKGMGAEFEPLLKGLNESVRREVIRDFVAATVLDFGNAGYYLLGEKYKALGNTVSNLVNVSQDIKSKKEYVGTIDEEGATFSTSIDPLARAIQRNKIKKNRDDVKNTLKTDRNSILETEMGPAEIDPSLVRNMEETPQSEAFAKSIAERLGFEYNGSMKAKADRYYMFTDPRSGSTYGVFGEQLTEEAVRDVMEANYKEWQERQAKAKGQTRELSESAYAAPGREINEGSVGGWTALPVGTIIRDNKDQLWVVDNVHQNEDDFDDLNLWLYDVAEVNEVTDEQGRKSYVSPETADVRFGGTAEDLYKMGAKVVVAPAQITERNIEDIPMEDLPGEPEKFTIKAPRTIGEQVKDFKGNTVREFWNFLKTMEGVVPKEWIKFFEKNLLPIVGEDTLKVMIFEDNVNGKPQASGRFRFFADLESPRQIEINSESLATTKDKIAKVLIHEAIHAWTAEFLHFGNPQVDTKGVVKDEKALAFYRQIDVLRKYFKDVLEGQPDRGSARTRIDLNVLKAKINSDPRLKAVINQMKNDNDEFIAYALMGDPKILDILNDIVYMQGGQGAQKNLFQRFLELLGDLMTSVFGRTPTTNSVLAGLTDIMSVYELDLVDYGKSIRAGTHGYKTDKAYRRLHNYHVDEAPNQLDHPLVDQLDEGQEDDDQGEHESIREALMVNSFSQFVATLMGLDLNQMYAALRNSTPSYVKKLISDLDNQHDGLVEEKLKALYNKRYKGYIDKYDTFRASMITRLLNRAQEVSHKKMYSFSTIFNRRTSVTDRTRTVTETLHRMVSLGDVHKDASGKTATTLREDIVLEEYIPLLEEVLNLPEGSIEVGFVESFDTYKTFGGKDRTKIASSNRSRLNNWMINKKDGDETTQSAFIGNKINGAKDTVNKKRFLYIGSFGDKNTLPILVINEEVYEKALEAIGRYKSYYTNIIMQAEDFQYNPSANESDEYSAVTRAILEDLWYGVDFKADNFQSIVALEDWNKKIQKRGTKWVYEKKAIQEDWDHVKDLFTSQDGMITPSAYSGITYNREARKIVVRNAIFAAEDQQLFEEFVEIDGITYNVGELLVNALGTSTTDGASFYILGEFDEVYSRVYGVIKQGALKNVVSSQLDGRGNPLFIKHAMHGLAPNDPLAVWMRKSNIAVLTSDTSAKVNSIGAARLSDIAQGKELTEGVIDLPLSNYHRYKEEQTTNFNSGKSRQAWNGSGFTVANPAIEAADTQGTFNQDLLTLMQRIVTLWVQDNIGDGIDHQGYTIDNAIEDMRSVILEPSSPKEESIARILQPLLTMEDGEAKENYRNVLNHTLFSNQLNNKLRNRLADVLQMVLPGARVALGPSLGVLAKASQVDPVTSEKSLRWHLRSLPVNDKVFAAAVPNEHVRDLLATIRELQRRYSLSTSKGDKESSREIQVDIKVAFENLDALVKDLAKETDSKEYKNYLRYHNVDSLFNMKDPIVEQWAARQIKKMINDNGTLKDGWTIITQDIASKYGIREGDRVLAVVTPTDSALSVAAVRVAAIVPSHGAGKKSEASKAIFNSEYIQTMVGKDYDIDTISIIPFDPDYWTAGQFDNVLNTVENAKEEYISRMVSSIQSLFDEKRNELIKLPGAIQDGELVKVNRQNVFSDEVRILFAQLMNGVRKNLNKEKYSILGNDFHYINDAYVKDVAPIITERLYHTVLSSLGISSEMQVPKFDVKGNVIGFKKIKLNTRHKSWFRTHMLHLIMTNHIVDFPNNTSMLHYNADMEDTMTREKMFQHTWGLTDEQRDEMGDAIHIIDEFVRIMFGRALQLAKLQSEDSQTATYFELLEGIEMQKRLLELFEAGDKQGIKNLYSGYVQQELEEYTSRTNVSKDDKEIAEVSAKEKIATINAFIDGMELADSVYSYPLFTLISSIPAGNAPHFGLTQKEALRAEVEVGKALAYTSPRITYLLNEGILAHKKGQKAPFFRDHELNKIYESYATTDGEVFADVESIALSLLAQEQDYQRKRHDRPLERTKRAAIAIIHAIDEVDKRFSTARDSKERQWNEEARSKAFPLLFAKVLEKNFVTLTGNQRKVSLKTSKGSLVLTVDETGRLHITDESGKVTLTPEQVLAGESEIALRARDLLTKEGGIWDSQSNRAKLSDFIKFPDNVSLDERREILERWLTTNLYGVFDAEDVNVFWISLIGQVTNNGLRDKRAINLQVNRTLLDPLKPYTYQYNDMLLLLLSKFAPQLRDSYLFHFNNIVEKHDRLTVGKVIQAVQEDTPGNSKVLFMADEINEEPKQTLIDVFYEQLSEIDDGFFSSSEYSKFKDLVHKEGFEAGLKELRKLFSDLAVLMTLSESGHNIDEIVDDIHHLPSAAFKQKYAKMNHPEIARTYNVHELKASDKITRAISLDPSTNTLKQLFYVHYKAKKTMLKKSKLPNKHYAGKMQDEVYGPMREKKTYIFADEDETIGHSMQVGTKYPQPITPRKVAIRYKILPNTNPDVVGEASLAIKKGEDVDRALSLHKEEMSLHLEGVEDMISILKSRRRRLKYKSKKTDDPALKRLLDKVEDSKTPDSLLRRLIFEMAEDMADNFGVRVFGDEERPGKWRYFHKDSNKPYNNAVEMLDKHFTDKSAEWKVMFLAALEYRKMYDHRAREIVLASINYLNQLYDDITATYGEANEGMRYIARAIDTYEKYLASMDERIGNYMPHRYPMHVYEELWKNQNAAVIRSGLKAQREAHQKMKKNGIQGWDPRIANRTDDEIAQLVEDRLEQAWARFEKGAVQTAFIPNFQKRLVEDPNIGYSKTSSKPHTDYVYRLIEGAKSDLLLADWYLFQKLAREKGENIGVINSVRHWFASQLTNKILHSRTRDVKNLKKGMHVSFVIPGEWIYDENENPTRAELRVSGIVRKITADRIYLFVDPTKAIQEARRRAKAYDNIHRAISDLPTGAQATAQQIKYINELVEEGYMDRLSEQEIADLTIKSANDKIRSVLSKAIQNPDKLGSFKRDMIYTRDIDGTKLVDKVDRFQRYGAIEFLETQAREIRNVKLMQGYWDHPVMDALNYARYKYMAKGLDVFSKMYRTTMGALILAFLNGPKALFRNSVGLLVSVMSHMPIRAAKGMAAGVREYFHLSSEKIEKMDQEQRLIYNILASLSLARTTSVVKLTLGSLNLNREELLVNKKWYQKVSSAWKLFNQASGYSAYVRRLRELNKEYRLASAKDKFDINEKIIELKKTWENKVSTIFESEPDYRPKDIDDLLSKLEEKGAADVDLNEAAELGITRKKALLAFGKTVFNTIYEGFPFGIKVQALAEYGRIPTFFHALNLAKYNNHAEDINDAIQYAINYVEAYNAFYSPQNKQRDANTKLGRAYLQFVQYQMTLVMTNIKMIQEAIVQGIGVAGPGIKGKLQHMLSLTKEDFVTAKELSKKLENKDYATKSDVNLARAVLARTISNAVQWQLGAAGTIMGLQYAIDPFMQAILGAADLLVDLFQYATGDDEDDEVLKQEIVEGVYETAFMYGVPWKQGLQIAFRKDDQDILDAIVQGRIASQFGTLERFVNTWNVFTDKEDLTRKERKKVITDPNWFVDNFITGFGLIGPKRYTPEETDWTRLSMFLGEEDLTFPPSEGIYDEERPWMGPIERMSHLWKEPHRSLLPLGHKLFDKE